MNEPCDEFIWSRFFFSLSSWSLSQMCFLDACFLAVFSSFLTFSSLRGLLSCCNQYMHTNAGTNVSEIHTITHDPLIKHHIHFSNQEIIYTFFFRTLCFFLGPPSSSSRFFLLAFMTSSAYSRPNSVTREGRGLPPF